MTKTKKKIYCLKIMEDYGDLWLGSNKKPIGFVSCEEAGFHLPFLLEYLGVELVYKEIQVNNEDEDEFYENEGDEHAIAKLLKNQIDKL